MMVIEVKQVFFFRFCNFLPAINCSEGFLNYIFSIKQKDGGEEIANADDTIWNQETQAINRERETPSREKEKKKMREERCL